MMLAEAYAGAGRSRRRDRLARGADGRRSAAAAGARRFLRARASLDRRGRRLRAGAAARAAQHRSEDALCLGADECRRPRERRQGARPAERGVAAARDAPMRARCICCRRRSGGSAISTEAEATARKVIAQNGKSPWGYYALAEALEERRAVSGGRRRARAGVAEFRGKPADDAVRRQASCCRISASPIRSSGSTTRRSPPSRKRASWRRTIRRSPAI